MRSGKALDSVSERRLVPDAPGGSRRWEEGIMHPMFVKLYLETSEDDLLAGEEDRRRAANRARRTRSRVATRSVVRDRDRLPPR